MRRAKAERSSGRVGLNMSVHSPSEYAHEDVGRGPGLWEEDMIIVYVASVSPSQRQRLARSLQVVLGT